MHSITMMRAKCNKKRVRCLRLWPEGGSQRPFASVQIMVQRLDMRRVVLLLMLAHACAAQMPELSRTGSMFNGRAWNGLSADAKMGYVMASFDYSHYAHLVAEENDATKPTSFDLVGNFSVGDYIKQIDKLYSDLANVNIPLPFALQYCSAEFTGLKTKQQLETFLISIRKLTMSLAK